MLNISFEKVSGRIEVSKYGAFKILEKKSISGVLIKIILGLMVLIILSMFLPWTQNIRAKGYVTTLNPYDRPQTIQ